MNWVDWLDLGSSIARFIALLVGPVFIALGVISWRKGDVSRATLWAVMAIYMQVLAVRP